jgi:hypothetical protein
MTLLVNSKIRGQAVFHTRFERQKDQVIPLVLLARMTLEIDRGDLTNRVNYDAVCTPRYTERFCC